MVVMKRRVIASAADSPNSRRTAIFVSRVEAKPRTVAKVLSSRLRPMSRPVSEIACRPFSPRARCWAEPIIKCTSEPEPIITTSAGTT